MNTDAEKLADALERWNAGALGAEELEQITRSLESPDARKALLDDWLLERALPESLSKAAIRQSHPLAQSLETATPLSAAGATVEAGNVVRVSLWRRSGLLRTLGTAAAGLVLGVFSASLVFGKAGLAQRKVVRILEDGFESGQSPESRGVPRSPGFWGGDYAQSVAAESGVQPRTGERMLKICRADYEGKSAEFFSRSGDLYRLIDLQGQDVGGGDWETMVTVSVNYRSVPFKEPGRYIADMQVHALESVPGPGMEGIPWIQLNKPGAPSSPHAPTASARRSMRLDAAVNRWQPLRVEMRIPPGTRYLLLSLHVTDSKAGREPLETGAVEFPGQFVDDVQVSLVPGAALR
jgi:hypothetical protein